MSAPGMVARGEIIIFMYLHNHFLISVAKLLGLIPKDLVDCLISTGMVARREIIIYLHCHILISVAKLLGLVPKDLVDCYTRFFL